MGESLDIASKSKYVVLHFYENSFKRCLILDKHFSILAQKHVQTRFIKLRAPKAPFLTTKLKVRTLPTVCIFIQGRLEEKFLGFEEFGGKDDFKTVVLENRLVKTGVIEDPNGNRFVKKARTQT